VFRHLISSLTVAVALSSGCTSSETSSEIVAPSADKCQVTAAASPTSFGANGGNGTVTVSAPRDCTWTTATDVSWISVNLRNGQGDATLNYSVARNGSPGTRRGTVTVGSHQLAVAQDGAPCHFDLDRSSADIGVAGGSVGVGLATISGCNWTATSKAGWIAVTQ